MAIFETISVFSIGLFLLLISNYDNEIISQFILIDFTNYSQQELILTYGSLYFLFYQFQLFYQFILYLE